MTNGSFMFGLVATVAMAAGPGIATAQSTGSSMQGSPSMQQQGGTQQGAMGQGSMGTSSGSSASAQNIPINGHFSFALVDGCNYDADVRGSARARGTSASGEQQYIPNVMIDASVTCPNRPTIHVTDRLANQSALTLAKLEQVLELRASLISETSGQHCAYVPDFRLSANQFQGLGAALLCPTQPGAMRGGGPAQSQQNLQNAPIQQAPMNQPASPPQPSDQNVK